MLYLVCLIYINPCQRRTSMTFQDIKTPDQLMTYLDEYIIYGIIDNNGNKYYDSNSTDFQNVCNEQWKLRSTKEILQDGVGHCYDQVEIEREWFAKNGFEVKTFWISAYQEEIENSGFSHTYLLYRDGSTWKLFEHSDFSNKGIYEFKDIKTAVKWQSEHQIKIAESCVKPLIQYTTCIKEYTKPPINVNMQEYLQFIDNSKDYEL